MYPPRVSSTMGERVAVLERRVDDLEDDVKPLPKKVEDLDRKNFLWSVVIVALIIVSKVTSPEVLEFLKHLAGIG